MSYPARKWHFFALALSLCFSFLSLLVSSSLYAGPVELYFRQRLQKPHQDSSESRKATLRVTTFNQLINHDDPSDTRTFRQRYFVNSMFAAGPNSPVLYYICGEAACGAGDLLGGIADDAQALHAHMVALEHRYYGASQPFTTLTSENMRYLNTDFALKDLARFQQSITQTNHWTGKWIAFGGSYSGSLSAFYRQRYPSLVVGALASSAPVRAKADFEEYDLHVATVAGSTCAAQMRRVVQQIETALQNPTALLTIKRKFRAEAIQDPIDFLYLVADIGASSVQYGFRDDFCNSVATAATPIDGYASFAAQIYEMFQTDAVRMSAQGTESTDPAAYAGIGLRQWLYQSCTEYGYWQIAYHDASVSVRSQLIDLDYHNNLCQRIFGIGDPVDVQGTNANFFDKLADVAVSRIFFTNGSEDPWSRLSIVDQTMNPNFTTMTIAGSAHCADLSQSSAQDSRALVNARSTFKQLAASWLR